jgi:glucose 1-dehydrogenase
MQIQLQHKRALVTGGNTGIGQAVALELAAAGADVAINYVSQPDQAEATAEEVKKRGVRALSLEADVTDTASVDKMFEQVEKEWGGLDILVNNAGIDGKRAVGWEADPQAWRKVLEVNLFGAFYCARAALKGMVSRKSGVVLNMTSVHEVIPWEGYSAYTASKSGLGMLTKTLAMEAAPYGVRVVALAPGAVKTSINQSVWSNPKQLKDLLAKIPFARMAETSEVAQMAVVLVSDAASYITGTTVYVDGGMTLYANFEHGG